MTTMINSSASRTTERPQRTGFWSKLMDALYQARRAEAERALAPYRHLLKDMD